jgi:membrane protein
VRDHLLLRASALTYFTVLSLVPLVAVIISVVSAIGVGSDRIAGWIVELVAAGSPEAQQKIMDLVSGANFGSLGTVGAVFLFITTVLAIGNIEDSLNRVWGVKQERSLVRRFSDYLAVLVVAPMLLGAGISLAGSLQSQFFVQRMLEIPWFAHLYDAGLRQAPLVVLALAFTFVNWFLPNTKVHFWSAALGGAIAAILVVAAQRLYLELSIGVARANAFFGGFAALPLLFMWIYVFWAIVLLGAEIAFAHQNLGLYRREVRGPRASVAEREAVGLRIALEIARAFRNGQGPWDADGLSDTLGVPVRTVREVMAKLHAAGILSHVGAEDREGACQLARPAAAIAITDVLGAIRGEREPALGSREIAEATHRILDEIGRATRRAVRSHTLEDVLEGIDGPVGPDPDPEDAPLAGSPRNPGGAGGAAQ